MVELADGTHTQLHAECDIKLFMPAQNRATYHTTLHCLVVDPWDDHDVILGQTWLNTESVDVSYGRRIIVAGRHRLVMECIKDAQPQPAHFKVRITAIRAKRMIKAGAKFFSVQVMKKPDSSAEPPPDEVDESNSPLACVGALPHVVHPCMAADGALPHTGPAAPQLAASKEDVDVLQAAVGALPHQVLTGELTGFGFTKADVPDHVNATARSPKIQKSV
jgi:hypothetical protein